MTHPPSIAAILTGRFSSFISSPAKACDDISVVLKNAPPPSKYEVAPSPRAGMVWSPGFWNYVGGWYVWQAGHWELDQPDQQYQHPGWQKVIHGWKLQRGRWRLASVNFIQSGVAAKGQDDGAERRYDPLAAFR
ncbi:YXWGXW repeat-containing protein [Collimonas sp.]|uniref:YXWGXW repeat-containing protein n=1 Tax=Collimonas sp. TaxID=1963772 RepID=UPI0037BE4B76